MADSDERRLSADQSPAISLDGVTRTYGATTAVEEVSFAVSEGEFFTLVGPSGCGKTTTLRLVGGFEQPTDGTVQLSGEEMVGVPPEERDIGIVFQNYALFPHMNVRENIAYGLNFTDPPDGQTKAERVEELLSLVDLEGMGKRDPDNLSGGQQQRVALARALAPGPSVLLLDEPMSALDAELRERLRVELKDIQQTLGVTTLYVTHDQEEALAISDRVAVMRDGRIEQIGTPREIYHQPATRFVAEFIGDNNVFDGELVTVQEETLTVRLDGNRSTVVEIERPEQGTFSAGPLQTGDHILFCIRPESLLVDHGENALEATVESTEFLGGTTRIQLDWNGRTLLVHGDKTVGEQTTIGFDPAAAHVIERL